MDIILGMTLAVLLAALFAVRRTLRLPLEQLTLWLRHARNGGTTETLDLPRGAWLAPVAAEAVHLATSLSEAREIARQEARLRVLGDPLWTAERLREHVQARLHGRALVVVSNREPYRHVRGERGVQCAMPPGGLVTGLEPVLRACGGTWVAHGDGDADRETCDAEGRLKVPPGNPQYTLRRVWLSPEEENGYYYGFANEGLWPLCHIAHTRPSFRSADWVYYQRVNRKFAGAALAEVAGQEEPFLLVQDYHLALLPRLIKEQRPDARIALFWHIPWPNPEAFGICPWQTELLEGMLGADLIGFHTQYNCNNFLDTVDRALESRVDRERFAVKRGGRATLVRPYPISVDFPDPVLGRSPADREAEREAIFRAHGVRPRYVALGVDRLDYTKGVIERLQAVERFLESRPEFVGRFTLFEIGAPSRTNIPRYREFVAQVSEETRRVNEKFKGAGAPPIVLMKRQHSRAEILPYYRAADVCLVTSLHDGMNLVAKEFVAANEDEQGVLILSRFTGAASELRDALIVNPYDIDGVALAIGAALAMSGNERALRMARLRRTVKENNIYRWAGDILEDLAAVRVGGAVAGSARRLVFGTASPSFCAALSGASACCSCWISTGPSASSRGIRRRRA